MARIPGIEPEKANLFTRFIYSMVKRKVGRIVEPVKVTAHNTGLLWGLGQMEQAIAGLHFVDKTLLCLASVKVATLIGCPF